MVRIVSMFLFCVIAGCDVSGGQKVTSACFERESLSEDERLTLRSTAMTQQRISMWIGKDGWCLRNTEGFYLPVSLKDKAIVTPTQ